MVVLVHCGGVCARVGMLVVVLVHVGDLVPRSAEVVTRFHMILISFTVEKGFTLIGPKVKAF